MALALLLLLFPLIVGIAMWISLDSRGSPLFVQIRLGKNGNPFPMYKFRTMLNDSEEEHDFGATRPYSAKKVNTKRVTRAGRFLRKSSLDELPQILNVILGDMSLVGPRPVLPRELGLVGPTQMKRFDVRPGITGLAQVSGRGLLTWKEYLDKDVEYVDNFSLSLYCSIILRTLPAVFSTRGAI